MNEKVKPNYGGLEAFIASQKIKSGMLIRKSIKQKLMLEYWCEIFRVRYLYLYNIHLPCIKQIVHMSLLNVKCI